MPVPHPEIRTGASAILMITASTCTIMLGRTIPVPRSAAPITCPKNCSASAGINQSRYVVPASTVASLAATMRM